MTCPSPVTQALFFFLKQSHIHIRGLDRRASNIEWKSIFPKAIIENYTIMGSDHSPLILDTSPEPKFGPYPLRFEWMWTTHPGCIEKFFFLNGKYGLYSENKNKRGADTKDDHKESATKRKRKKDIKKIEIGCQKK